MDATANEALGEMGTDFEDYRQIPDKPRYGRLRGLYVRQEIYDDLMGAYDFLPTEPGWFQNLLGYGGVGTTLTQLWKASKVSLNPPAQVRNFVSNMILLQLSGVPLHRMPGLLVRAVSQIANNGQYWQTAKKYGVTESTFNAQELYRLKRGLLDLEKRQGLNPLGRIRHAAAIVLDVAGDAYQMMEALGKTMKIIDAMERQGMPDWQAAIEAQKWLFDYSLVPKSVRYARSAPIGMPFITFHYKVLPRLLEIAVLHPQRFLPWVALYYGLMYAAAAAFGVDDDDIDKLKKALPEWLQKRGFAAVLPYKDELGRVQVVDLGYFFPWSMWTEAGGALAKGEFMEALKTLGIFSGPITDIIVAMKTGKDPFTQRDIVQAGDPPARQIAALVNYVWDMAMPPIVSSRGFLSPMGLLDKAYGGKLTQAVTGTTDKFGSPRATVEQAILGTVGVNLYALDPDSTRAQNLQHMTFELEKVRTRLKRQLEDQGLTAERRRELVTEYFAEIKRRQEKLQQYIRESEVHPKLRAPTMAGE
ncbi:MAG: hypothetical protein HY323_02115 [Betaproteobacteria bacterium]|nr:hypothetical protein [Betaproteobacteria bacterium]